MIYTFLELMAASTACSTLAILLIYMVIRSIRNNMDYEINNSLSDGLHQRRALIAAQLLESPGIQRYNKYSRHIRAQTLRICYLHGTYTSYDLTYIRAHLMTLSNALVQRSKDSSSTAIRSTTTRELSSVDTCGSEHNKAKRI